LYSIPKSYLNYVTKSIDTGFMYVIMYEMTTLLGNEHIIKLNSFKASSMLHRPLSAEGRSIQGHQNALKWDFFFRRRIIQLLIIYITAICRNI
jgi:hypothetical protein